MGIHLKCLGKALLMSTHNTCFLGGIRNHQGFWLKIDNDDEFRFNDASTHEGNLCQNGILIWFSIEMAIQCNNNKSVMHESIKLKFG